MKVPGNLIDPGVIGEGDWGVVYGRFHCRPPGTPRALPLSPQHTIRFVCSEPTVEPSIHYDPAGPWEWHGWLRDGKWESVGEAALDESEVPEDTEHETISRGTPTKRLTSYNQTDDLTYRTCTLCCINRHDLCDGGARLYHVGQAAQLVSCLCDECASGENQ